MQSTYVLFSITGGWLTSSATYSSDLEQAQKFPRSEALELAKRHYRPEMMGFGLIPVNYDDLLEVRP